VPRPLKTHRKSAVVGTACVALASLLGGCGGSGNDGAPALDTRSAENRPPTEIRRQSGLNVLLITVDTLRADALGSYGNPRGATPWMDRLAAAGIRFDNAHAHNVVTLPSHASILSGLLPTEHGIRDNSGFTMPAEIETLATLLSAEGYRTGAFISAFPLDSRFGLDRGFEVYEDRFVGVEPRRAFLEQERSGERTVELAAGWLEEDDPRPSFAWVHLYEPHYPYEPPEPFATRFRNAPYLGDVAAADAALEPLVRPILERTQDGNTVVVLTSDHGESLGEHGEATHGIFAYEGALRVPLILYQPGLLSPRTVDEPARLIDVMPTVLDLLGLEPPAPVAGRSLISVANGRHHGAEPTTYFEALSGQLNRGWAPLYGVIRDDWKFIELPIPELYDLASDPDEAINLESSERARAEGMQSLLATFRARDDGRRPEPVDAETRERLATLGYVTAGGHPLKDSYGEEDDPKRLIGLDEVLREIGALHAAGNLEEARVRARELVKAQPQMRIAHMHVAQIERDLGNLEAAIGALETARDLNPDDPTTLALLASYLAQSGRNEEAARVTAKHSSGPSPDPDVILTRSLALARSGQPGHALEMVDRARQLDPGNPLVEVHAGTVYLISGDRQSASAAFERSLELNPRTTRAHTSLALMAIEEGRFDEALEHWRRAVEIDPGELRTLLAVALRMWNAGAQAQARPFLELFVSMAPEQRFASEIERVRRMLGGSR
jgi:arylsulfatase A-like enzyme/Flp pilus assembly protein TadD